jgi:hypothetical protein
MPFRFLNKHNAYANKFINGKNNNLFVKLIAKILNSVIKLI